MNYNTMEGSWGEMVAYFAYGSCMNQGDFAKSVNYYEVMGVGILRNHSVDFRRFSSRRQGGVATITPVEGEYVEGILYQIPSSLLVELDRREGAPTVYQRTSVVVELGSKLLPAITYILHSPAAIEFAPSEHYMNLILDGAVLLSSAYRGMLSGKMRGLRIGQG